MQMPSLFWYFLQGVQLYLCSYFWYLWVFKLVSVDFTLDRFELFFFLIARLVFCLQLHSPNQHYFTIHDR